MTTPTYAPKITMSLCVIEEGDSAGRWLYSSAHSVEAAIKGVIDRCTDHGYAFGKALVKVYEGNHATPVGATKLGEYRTHGKKGTIEAI